MVWVDLAHQDQGMAWVDLAHQDQHHQDQHQDQQQVQDTALVDLAHQDQHQQDQDMVWVDLAVAPDMAAWGTEWAQDLAWVSQGMVGMLSIHAARQRRSREACTQKRMGSTTWPRMEILDLRSWILGNGLTGAEVTASTQRGTWWTTTDCSALPDLSTASQSALRSRMIMQIIINVYSDSDPGYGMAVQDPAWIHVSGSEMDPMAEPSPLNKEYTD